MRREITGVTLLSDGKSVLIRIKNLKPTWGMSIKCRIKAADGTRINLSIHNTIHKIGESRK